jgi:hypothetical protein
MISPNYKRELISSTVTKVLDSYQIREIDAFNSTPSSESHLVGLLTHNVMALLSYKAYSLALPIPKEYGTKEIRAMLKNLGNLLKSGGGKRQNYYFEYAYCGSNQVYLPIQGFVVCTLDGFIRATDRLKANEKLHPAFISSPNGLDTPDEDRLLSRAIGFLQGFRFSDYQEYHELLRTFQRIPYAGISKAFYEEEVEKVSTYFTEALREICGIGSSAYDQYVKSAYDEAVAAIPKSLTTGTAKVRPMYNNLRTVFHAARLIYNVAIKFGL